MDRLKQMETFVAVAARGSLTAAALAEGVAPAIIGRRMDALEARLGDGDSNTFDSGATGS